MTDPDIFTTAPEAYEIRLPRGKRTPVVFASPHSGSHYTQSFVAAAKLDPIALRRSEDAFVDELFATAPAHGAPLLRALFPRAYVDPNRERMELDPAMFSDRLPGFVTTRSPRITAGLGTIAKVVTNGAEIYCDRLTFAEAEDRLQRLYDPYHEALRRLVDETRDMFSYCVLIDCHSMPSIGGPMDADTGNERVDFVLGDRFGVSCGDSLTHLVQGHLGDRGYVVRRNAPYAGGFTTRHYGQPLHRVHALQIEINRTLYMDEETITRTTGMAKLKSSLERLVADLTAFPADQLLGA